jgi:SAM-dependent methyltransferase
MLFRILKRQGELGGMSRLAVWSRVRAFREKSLPEKLTSVTYRVEALRDRIYERMRTLDFGGYVASADLVVESGSSTRTASAYEPISTIACREGIREAMAIAGPFDNFVDVGCGKGRACIYAAKEFSFRTVVGVDFSKPLVEVAERNRLKSGLPNVSFVHADATRWTLPPGKTLVLLNNPFDASVLERFVRANLASFSEQGSLILYVADIHRNILPLLGFEAVYRSARTVRSIHRYLRQAQA